MRATARLLVATNELCGGHRPPPGHPDRPERLRAAVAGAAAAGAEALAAPLDEAAALAAIARVHAPALADRLRRACEHPPGPFDSDDNPVSRGTYSAALAAAAAAVVAAGAVATGGTAWVPVRPPGHHALRDRAMGFCFFNNAAVAAEELLARGCGPVAIVDFDVHHGNGTQAHFWERDDAFFLSIHRYPFFPGSGAGDEVGAGRGRGFTRNVPLAAGADDAVYREALEMGLEELGRVLRPAAWVVSAGFDAHREDPLGGMNVSDEGFGTLGRLLRAAAGKSPLVAVLEGGYSLEALYRSVRAFTLGVAGGAGP
ncbi:MAG: histone deacetylase [Thermoanaerobaculaceae bacterium]|nr:histone deacetylase [Thermoanaerobaculaceae bacterium]TAM51659.1 MAG: histone deacetylase [Acidobacteriota bacterium]